MGRLSDDENDSGGEGMEAEVALPTLGGKPSRAGKRLGLPGKGSQGMEALANSLFGDEGEEAEADQSGDEAAHPKPLAEADGPSRVAVLSGNSDDDDDGDDDGAMAPLVSGVAAPALGDPDSDTDSSVEEVEDLQALRARLGVPDLDAPPRGAGGGG